MPLADTLIINASVLTMDPAQPRASAIAIKDGRILALGSGTNLERLRDLDTLVLNAYGATVTPGFIDAHIHLHSWAGAKTSVDCSPSAGVRSIGDIQRVIAEKARTLPQGAWIRASGYDEFALAEKRHLTRHDLDIATPDHPVKLAHRSGIAWVLNSRALKAAGIRMESEEPPGGAIEREVPSGEPSGFLLEMDDYLKEHTPGPAQNEVEWGMARISDDLLSYGVVQVVDAGESNDLSTWQDLQRYKRHGLLRMGVTMMTGASGRRALQESGLSFLGEDQGLRLGGVKLVLSESSGRLFPSRDALYALVEEAHLAGFQVALHAVGAEAVEAATEVLRAVRSAHPGRTLRHRLEHAFITSPQALERIRESGAGVVTQPGFLYHGGERILAYVAPEEKPWLYRTASFHKAGVPLAASSDAPVGPADPRIGLYTLMARRSAQGTEVNGTEGLALDEAVALYTRQAAYLTHQEHQRGVIAQDYFADLAIWDRDLTKLKDPQELLEARVDMTLIAGAGVYER